MVLMKNRKFLLLSIPALLLICSLFAFRIVDFKTSKSLEIFFAFFRELNIFYVDDTDSEQLVKVGIDAMLESLDPYNEFIPEENIETLEFQTTGEYGGMGAIIRQGKDYPTIAEVYENSPAHKAGLMTGDIILRVDTLSVKGLAVDHVSRLLKGVPKSNLSITVKRYGSSDSLQYSFKREKIHVSSVPYFGMVSKNTGYIRVANFTADCSKEVESAFKNLKSKDKITGLILDFRGNPGGLLQEAVKIVNLFVQKNELVVYTKGKIKEFDQEYKTTSRPADTEMPLIVLVDRASASASEIVAGAFQDLDRAVIVGERTFGKGLVQATRSLPYNTQLKLTTAKYYIPSGRCIQAVDYTLRDENGNVGNIPDSLSSEFKTRNGRSVRDGGGIVPDIQYKQPMYSHAASILYGRNILFDYATRYHHAHKQIEQPNLFSLTDREIDDFYEYLKEINFSYQSQAEYQYKEFIKTSQQEELLPLFQRFADSIQTVIDNNSLKALYAKRSEIKKLLEEEIVGRYYFQKGRVQCAIVNDEIIQISLGVLVNRNQYSNILSASSTEEKVGAEM